MVRWFTQERRRTVGHWVAELGIVVFGVLIALYAQQWDSDRQARKHGAEAEQRIRQEMFENAAVQMERLALHTCLKDRLATIVRKIRRGDNDWDSFAYPPHQAGLWGFRRIYRVPSRNYRLDAFEGALASGALDLLPPARLGAIAGQYRQYQTVAAMQLEETALSARLDGLSAGEPLGLSERNALLGTISLLDRYNGLTALIAKQSIAKINELGFGQARKISPNGKRRWPRPTAT